MISIGIRYLMDRAVATNPSSYDEPEWPPHPARVLMALAAAHFETRGDPPTGPQAEEREALEWLAGLGAPGIHRSEAHRVPPVKVYVPVNDVEISSRAKPRRASRGKVAEYLEVLPGRRSRQPRTFPRAIPHDPEVWLVWPDAEADVEVREALKRVCRKVTRLGHSSSPVQMWVGEEDEPPAPNLVPDATSTTDRLRVPADGLLEELEALYDAGLRPAVSLWARYGAPEAGRAPGSVFAEELIILRLEPGESRFSELGLESTSRIIDYFRRAVIAVTPDPVPECISGHRRDGTPSEEPHLAFLPLAFTGSRHADGHLLGLAIALPRSLSDEERSRVDAAVAELVSPPSADDPGRLVMGRLGRWRLEPVIEAAPARTLRAETWTAPSASWASVTPVVLDRFTHDEDQKREIVARSCQHAGLPRPAEVRLSHVSPLRGVPPSPAFGPLDGGDGATRPFTHVFLRFEGRDGEPLKVRGPVLIGAGRYRGYGLLRPYWPQLGA